MISTSSAPISTRGITTPAGGSPVVVGIVVGILVGSFILFFCVAASIGFYSHCKHNSYTCGDNISLSKLW